MKKTNPTLNLSYARLLELTKEFLCQLVANHEGFRLDQHERGLRSGVILHWHTLSLETGVSDKQRKEDYNQLRLLAGLSVDDQEPTADGH